MKTTGLTLKNIRKASSKNAVLVASGAAAAGSPNQFLFLMNSTENGKFAMS